MARTNAVIAVTYRNKSYNGTQNSVAMGNYAAWIEEHVNAETITTAFGGSVGSLERAKGIGMIFEDIDLKNSFITYNNNAYEVIKFAKFTDYRGNVHHVEFIYG